MIGKKDKLERIWPVLFILPIAAFLLSFAIGRFPISIPDLLHTIFYHFADPSKVIDPNMETVLFNIRLPRVLAALIIGGGLSISGASYQGMFKNPMVSPDILGASAGAAVGACIAMLYGLPTIYVQAISFCCGIVAVALASVATKRFSRDAILGLVLGGIMVSTLFQSGTSAVKLLADADNKLPIITFWLMGSFNTMNKARLISILIPMGIGFITLFLMRWHLNVLSFGEEEARSLGIKTKRVRTLVIIASTLISASCVSVCGMVGWIGLVIPHLGRAFVGPDFKRLIPVCIVLGSTFLLIVDNVARMAFAFELPIGILTSFIGVPFFFFIFKNNTKGGDNND
ncbi:MAG: iron ABC transporter permease [Oscillospiraceae bacterium]|jgi:iron complex transport system permease protein|nr:iron ABC transporter permease [Oscillospiraceae bacterium]